MQRLVNSVPSCHGLQFEKVETCLSQPSLAFPCLSHTLALEMVGEQLFCFGFFFFPHCRRHRRYRGCKCFPTNMEGRDVLKSRWNQSLTCDLTEVGQQLLKPVFGGGALACFGMTTEVCSVCFWLSRNLKYQDALKSLQSSVSESFSGATFPFYCIYFFCPSLTHTQNQTHRRKSHLNKLGCTIITDQPTQPVYRSTDSDPT